MYTISHSIQELRARPLWNGDTLVHEKLGPVIAVKLKHPQISQECVNRRVGIEFSRPVEFVRR